VSLAFAEMPVVQVMHRSPSSNYYIDVIEIEVDGSSIKKTDVMGPQSSATFGLKYAVAAAAKNI
jgi:hypothetical protein